MIILPHRVGVIIESQVAFHRYTLL